MTQLLHGLMSDVRGLLVAFMVIMSIVFAIMTWNRTRALVPTIGAVLFGALVVLGVASTTSISNRIREDVEDNRDNTENVGNDVTPLSP
jgi:hypothetical protein